MRAPNRIVVTAARADRPSFGCAVERTYAVFDECLLARCREKRRGGAVCRRDAKLRARSARRELQATPSEPQATFGAQVRDLRVR